MLCEAPPGRFDRFSGSQAPSGVRPARAKHCSSAVLCQVWPPAPAEPGLRIPRKLAYWLSDSCSGCPRSSGARRYSLRRFHPVPGGYKTHNEAQHASKTPHQIGQAESVRDKNWATHGRANPLYVRRIPGRASASFGHSSHAKWRRVACFWNEVLKRSATWAWTWTSQSWSSKLNYYKLLRTLGANSLVVLVQVQIGPGLLLSAAI